MSILYHVLQFDCPGCRVVVVAMSQWTVFTLFSVVHGNTDGDWILSETDPQSRHGSGTIHAEDDTSFSCSTYCTYAARRQDLNGPAYHASVNNSSKTHFNRSSASPLLGPSARSELAMIANTQTALCQARPIRGPGRAVLYKVQVW